MKNIIVVLTFSLVASAQTTTRSVGGCPIGYGNMYWNSSILTLPVDYANTAKIAALGVGRLGPSPEFLLNLATTATPTQPSNLMNIDVAQPGNINGEADSGSFPITPTSLVSVYMFGVTPTVAAGPYAGQDDHVLMLNTSTCILYEVYLLQNNTPPYHIAFASIIGLKDNNLRTTYHIIPYSVDSDGLDNGTASGMAIWPFVFTHAEIFSGNPILHAGRIALSKASASPGWQWPATHSAGGTGNTNILLGATLRLHGGFDTITCHANENTGQTYPPYARNLLIALEKYGVYFSDFSDFPGLISTDADQAWGDPNLSTSDNWALAGWMHCVQLSDLEFVDNVPRILAPTSGIVNQNFVVR
jgi:hypothetical protein